MTELSIIVPVYNSEKYIEETVFSLENQNYKNIEIILVDDGSTDCSASIINKLAEKYKNIVTVFQKNSGPGAARNKGIEKASGEYIAFCDSDDTVDKNIYVKLADMQKASGSELVLCDFYSERNKGVFGIPWESGKIFERDEMLSELLPLFVGNESDNGGDKTLWGSVVRCIFKRSIIIDNQIRFYEDIEFAEDLIFFLEYIAVCRRAAVISEALYFYRNNPGSIMNSYTHYKEDMFEKRMAVINRIEKILKGLLIYEENKMRVAETVRGFVYECIGNACIYEKNRNFCRAYRDVKQILKNERTKAGFYYADAKRGKKVILNFAIKRRYAFILTSYYRVRFLLK